MNVYKTINWQPDNGNAKNIKTTNNNNQQQEQQQQQQHQLEHQKSNKSGGSNVRSTAISTTAASINPPATAPNSKNNSIKKTKTNTARKLLKANDKKSRIFIKVSSFFYFGFCFLVFCFFSTLISCSTFCCCFMLWRLTPSWGEGLLRRLTFKV